jgi:hypothetical protein
LAWNFFRWKAFGVPGDPERNPIGIDILVRCNFFGQKAERVEVYPGDGVDHPASIRLYIENRYARVEIDEATRALGDFINLFEVGLLPALQSPKSLPWWRRICRRGVLPQVLI